MFTISLIGQPGGLDPSLAVSLRNAWGGGEVRWLSPDEAAEFDVAAQPENFWSVWADAQSMSVDLVPQPAEGRRKRVLIADMDSTMIQQECIDELAEVAGVGAHVREITARAMNGELDFEEAVRARVGLLEGMSAEMIERVLTEQISYMPGGDVLLATMRTQGAYTALVSGGFTQFTSAVAAHLGFDENRANTLLVENNVLTGKVGEPILGRDAKVQALTEITERLGLKPEDAIAVGDGANDLGMLGLAGTGVALHAKPAVAAECDVRIQNGDLTALLFLQGYAKTEFICP